MMELQLLPHPMPRVLVTGVRYDSGNIYLEIGDKEVSLADVNNISN